MYCYTREKGRTKALSKLLNRQLLLLKQTQEKTSLFVQQISKIPVPDIQPQWINFDKDLTKSKAGSADLLYVQNKTNDLFNLYYRFDMGALNSKFLPLAAQYLDFLGTDKKSSEQFHNRFTISHAVILFP